MKYLIKKTLSPLINKIIVMDEKEQGKYFLKRQRLSLGNKFILKDENGEEKLVLDQNIFSFSQQFNISKGNEHIATLRKRFLPLFNYKFEITCDNNNSFFIENKKFPYDYKIFSHGECVATISNEKQSSDFYIITITSAQDESLIMAFILLIHLIFIPKAL